MWTSLGSEGFVDLASVCGSYSYVFVCIITAGLLIQ